MLHIISSVFGPFKPENLAGEDDRGGDGFQFPATQAQILPINLCENGDAGDDHRTTYKHSRCGRSPFAPRDPERNQQAIALREKSGRRGRGVRHAIHLKQNAGAGKQPQADASRFNRASEGAEISSRMSAAMAKR